jgi:hypothetical protein
MRHVLLIVVNCHTLNSTSPSPLPASSITVAGNPKSVIEADNVGGPTTAGSYLISTLAANSATKTPCTPTLTTKVKNFER